jgi:MFS family permease
VLQPWAPAATATPLRTTLSTHRLSFILRQHATLTQQKTENDDEVNSGVGFLDRSRSAAPRGFNRWHAVPGGILVTTSIGAVYAWSSFNAPLCRTLGVVAPAASDWELGSVVPIFSFAALTLGIGTSVLGTWSERSGPRMTAAAATACWSGGLCITSLATYTHTLPLCYLGYGILGGLGWGLGYISPVSNLMKWFPDRRGLATGMALASFGGGAILASPMNIYFMNKFFVPPDYLGTLKDITVVTENGVRYAQSNTGEMIEVVVATAADVAKLPGELMEGVYVVGTGSTGVAETFLSLGGIHCAAMLAGTLMMRIPRDGWSPEGYIIPDEEAQSTVKGVSLNTTMKTPQFWLLWTVVFGNAIAGVSIMACAKDIMNDVFVGAFPGLITAGFLSAYISSLSAANGTGRFAWATASDYLGRKNTIYTFGLAIPIALGLPYVATMVSDGGSGTLPLFIFYGGSVLAISFYGGIFSVLPAYIADLFGMKNPGAIHGRALTAWSASAVVGPTILTTLRKSSYDDAVSELALVCDPQVFYDTYGATISELQTLIDTKTVTIPSLMEIVPAGTHDPTPHIYDSTFYTMSGFIAVAMLCNAMIKPVPREKFDDGGDDDICEKKY